MSCLRLTGRLVALFIILIFVTMTPSLILAYNAQQAALSGDFLDELLDDTALFEEAIPEMADDLAREMPREYDTRDMPIAELDADDWERIIYVIAPPERMQEWSQEAVDEFRYWIRRDGRFLEDMTLPFGEMRDNIINDPEQTVLRTLTQAQPPCSGGQEPLGGRDNLIPQCRPPESRLEGFYQRLGEQWREQSRQVWRQLWPDDLARYPDDISLADFIEEESGEEVWEVRASWRAGRWGLSLARWALIAFTAAQCVVALGLVALFAARNWREAFRWVSAPIVVAGVFTLLLALAFLIGGEIGTFFISDEQVPIAVQEVVGDAARAFFLDLWPPMAWQGGVLVLIGLGLGALSFFAPAHDWIPAPVTTAPVVSEPTSAEPTEEADAEPSVTALDEETTESEENA